MIFVDDDDVGDFAEASSSRRLDHLAVDGEHGTRVAQSWRGEEVDAVGVG